MEREALARFEEGVLAFLAERREALGVEEGGLNNYYAQRLDKRRALSRYERELIVYLKGAPRVIHAGTGMGPLSAALALQGTQVIGFEADPRRHAAAEALRARLARDAAYEVRQALFPQGLRDGDDPAGATLLFTNVVAGWPEGLYDDLIAAMRGFSRTILDLRVFGQTREDPAERAALAAKIEAGGLSLASLPFVAANTFYVEASLRA